MAHLIFRMRRSTRFLFSVLITLCFGFSAQSVLAQSQSGFTYNGVVYVSYQAGEYLETPQGPQGTAAIRATGANYTSVMVTQYEQTYTSNTIAPETASTPGYVSTSDPLSPTDAAVVAAIQNAQAQGLIVFLKPQVDSLDGTYRGNFAPTNPTAWFKSYQTFILHYAQLASQNGVGGLIIGTELASLTGPTYRSNWLTIISQIRALYPSLTLIYGANATSASDEFTTVSFWDQVDIIGVDGYFPLTNQADPTVAQLVAAWTNNKSGLNIVSALKSLQSQYNKPLIFTELGYVSATGTNEAPYASATAGAAYDPTEQANCYEAFFQVFSQQSSWMKGVFWWAWNVSPPGSADLGYTPQNKPAGTVELPKWYGSTTAGFTLAPSNAILNLQAGNSATEVVAQTNLGGFTATPALTVSGLPSGVTGAFSAGTAPGTQVLTLTASNTAVSGPASILVSGTSGALSASTPIALTVQPAAVNQTITFAQPAAQLVGTPLTLTATASSGLAVVYTSTTPTVCTVSGSTATFLTPGTCTLDANQAGTSAYNAAPQVQVSFAVSGNPSFTLASPTPAVTVAQGQSITAGLTISPANGFASPVSLTAAGLPSGATVAFSTNPATSSSTVTFTAGSTTPIGSSSVTIIGTSGSLSTSAVFTVNVVAAPSIAITAPTAAVSINPGSTGTAAISVMGAGGFSGTVTLTAAVTSSPTNAVNPPTASFGTTSMVSVNGSTPAMGTLTIKTTAPTTAALTPRERTNSRSQLAGGAAFASVLMLGLCFKRTRQLRLLSLLLVSVLFGGLAGCTTLNPNAALTTTATTPSAGTTAGAYVITVTATAGNLTSMATVPVTVP